MGVGPAVRLAVSQMIVFKKRVTFRVPDDTQVG